MWTPENRKRYGRSRLRYPSDLTDDEWALAEPHIAPARRGGRKREAQPAQSPPFLPVREAARKP